MVRRVIVLLFPRNRYRASTGGSKYVMRDRAKLMRSLGGAMRVTIHARVYDRSGNGAVVDFALVQGCFGEEPPGESPRQFTLGTTSVSPSLPWNNTNMANLPDDGTFTITPAMGLVDIVALVTGGANTDWIEFEIWATLEFSG